jgi:hypothetical protein
MKIPAIRRSYLSLWLLAAVMTLSLGFESKTMAQSTLRQTPRSPYKFTIRNGEQKTDIKVTVAQGRVTYVSGTRDGRTFKFKRLKAGEKPKLVGKPEQTLNSLKLKTSDNLKWSFGFYSDRNAQTGAEYIDSWTASDGDGGGGGGGTVCWENQELQMSICDP